jgi:hypothetical protein
MIRVVHCGILAVCHHHHHCKHHYHHHQQQQQQQQQKQHHHLGVQVIVSSIAEGLKLLVA